MRCKKYEKWISDSLDGQLSSKRSRRLHSHLAHCSACRAYQEKSRRLQEEMLDLERVEFPPGYWGEFTNKLALRLRAVKPERLGWKQHWRSWKWAWAGAAIFVAAALGLIFFLPRGPEAAESYVFSFERCLDLVYREIGDDSQLADLINLSVVRSLEEGIGVDSPIARPLFVEDPFFLESLSEEELELLDREVEIKIKS